MKRRKNLKGNKKRKRRKEQRMHSVLETKTTESEGRQQCQILQEGVGLKVSTGFGN